MKALRIVTVAILMVLSVKGRAVADNWTYFSGDNPKDCSGICVTQYVSSLPPRENGFEKLSIRVLTDFSEAAQSATTFGLSEIEVVVFDCLNSRMKSLSDTWYSKALAQGKVTKVFPATKKWVAIPQYDIALFAKVCAP